MPRGVKAAETIEEQISDVESRINTYQTKIASLNAKKKELVALKEKAEMDILYKIVKDSGKSPADLIKQLSNS